MGWMFWKTARPEVLGFDRAAQILQRVSKRKNLQLTICEAQGFETGLRDLKHVDDPWLLTGETDIDWLSFEMKGENTTGQNSLGSLAFEPFSEGVPLYITCYISVDNELFNELFARVVSSKDGTWQVRIKFEVVDRSDSPLVHANLTAVRVGKIFERHSRRLDLTNLRTRWLASMGLD